MYTKSFSQLMFTIAVLAVVGVLFAFGHTAEAVILAPAAIADLETLSTEMKAAVTDFNVKRDELSEQFKELKGKMEKGEFIPKELKEAIDKSLVNFNGLKANMETMEQTIVAIKAAPSQERAEKSWGEQFIETDGFKNSGGSAMVGAVRGEFEKKAVTSTTAAGLINSYREQGILNLLRERRVIRDLLPTVRIATSSVDYAKQTVRTNNAAPVAEAAAKPYSEYEWAQASVVVRVLAHLTKITRQAMDDAPRLMGEIDSEMRYGLGFVEERQFLYGSGAGNNLHGIMPQATAFAVPGGFARRAGTTKIDVVRVAMLQNAVALLPADGVVLNDIDWVDIQLTKDSTGAYLFSDPQSTVDARLWGLPIVTTPAMTAGDFLVGCFKLGATVYDRMAVEVLISTENADDFEKNLATMRAEERVAIAVKRPLAFTKGTFTTAITAINPP